MATQAPHLSANEQTMAPEQSKTPKQQWAATNYLVTPPEDNMDSFSQGDEDEALRAKGWEEAMRSTLPPIQDRTPPTSPAINILPSISSATGFPTRDAPLFPDSTRTERDHSQTPLFENEEQPTKPSPVEPHALSFPAILGIRTEHDARQYFEDRRDEIRRLKQYQFDLPLPRVTTASAVLDYESRRQLHSLTRTSGVVKTRATPRPAPKATPKIKATAAASPNIVSPPKRRSPKPRTYSDFVDAAFPSAQQPTKHKRAPPSKKTDGDRAHWSELADYAPPITDLNTNSRQLKVSWPSSALSLADDADQTHLHPQEIAVASTLRLTCAVYLYNKRKIFQARLQAFKDGKNFTKTAAQSACHIDVNKASQLWEAYDRVGWFNRSWFEKWL